MGGLTRPQVIQTGRDTALDQFSGGLSQGGGTYLANQFRLPAYGGQMTAQPNFLQGQAAGVGAAAPGQFGQGTGQDVISQLLGMASPQGVAGIMGQIPGMEGLQGIAGGQNPFQVLMQRLLGAGAIPERGALGGAAGSNPAQGPINQLMSLFSSQQSQAAPSLPDIFGALDTQRRQGLGRDTRDLREMFGQQGLRFSSDLANAVGTRQTESEQGGMAEFMRMVPALMGAQSQGLQTLGGLGESAGRLALGQQSNTLQGLQGAGQLGLEGIGLDMNALAQLISGQGGASSTLGQLGTSLFGGGQQNALAALLGLPGAQGQYQDQQLGMAERLFGLGEGFRGIEQGGLDRQYGDFQNQLAMLAPILQFFGGTPSPNVGPSPLTQFGNLAIGAAGTAAGVKGAK